MTRIESPALAAALVALQTDARLHPVVDWIDASLTEIEQRARHEGDVTQLRWLQGAAQELSTVQAAINEARETLARMRT